MMHTEYIEDEYQVFLPVHECMQLPALHSTCQNPLMSLQRQGDNRALPFHVAWCRHYGYPVTFGDVVLTVQVPAFVCPNSMLRAQANINTRPKSCQFSTAGHWAVSRSLRVSRFTSLSSAELRSSRQSSLPSHAGLSSLQTWRTHQRVYARKASWNLGALPAALPAECTVREVRYDFDMLWPSIPFEALLRYLSLLNRQDDVDDIVSLQSKGFYEKWDIDWLDTFFLKLFAVSIAGNTALQCKI